MVTDRSVTDAVFRSTSSIRRSSSKFTGRGSPGPVPQAEDVVATAVRSLVDIDLTDERSLAAAVRDAVAARGTRLSR